MSISVIPNINLTMWFILHGILLLNVYNILQSLLYIVMYNFFFLSNFNFSIISKNKDFNISTLTALKKSSSMDLHVPSPTPDRDGHVIAPPSSTLNRDGHVIAPPSSTLNRDGHVIAPPSSPPSTQTESQIHPDSTLNLIIKYPCSPLKTKINLNKIKLPPKMLKRGRPKGAGQTVVGIPKKKKKIVPCAFIDKSLSEKLALIILPWITTDVDPKVLPGDVKIDSTNFTFARNLLEDEVQIKLAKPLFEKSAWKHLKL